MVKILVESGEDVDQRDQVLVYPSLFKSSVKPDLPRSVYQRTPVFFSHLGCANATAYEQALALVFAVVSRGISCQWENRPFAGGQSPVERAVSRRQKHTSERVKQRTRISQNAFIRLILIALVKLSTAWSRTLMMASSQVAKHQLLLPTCYRRICHICLPFSDEAIKINSLNIKRAQQFQLSVKI